MKHLKSKLMIAITMLCISTVMLTGVSFAWYTISTNPEITNITTSVSANENLEIALDNGYIDQAAVDTASSNASVQGGAQGSITGNPYTWGNLVDLSYAYGTNGINGKLALKPIKYIKVNDKAVLQYPKYGADGRISSLDNLTSYAFTDHADVTAAASTVYDHNGVTAYSQDTTQDEDTTVYDAMSVTYWLRSNMDTDVSLSAAAKRAESSEDSATADPTSTDANVVEGAGSYISIPATAGDDINNKLYDWLTTGKLKIQFDVIDPSTRVVSETYFAYPTATAAVAASGETGSEIYKYDLVFNSTATSKDTEAPVISLTKNTAKTITMYVFIDGEIITNADAFMDDLSDMKLNIQFDGTNIDDSIDVQSIA